MNVYVHNIRGDNRQNTENRERISNFWKSSSPLPERILRGKAVLSTLDRRAYPYVSTGPNWEASTQRNRTQS